MYYFQNHVYILRHLGKLLKPSILSSHMNIRVSSNLNVIMNRGNTNHKSNNLFPNHTDMGIHPFSKLRKCILSMPHKPRIPSLFGSSRQLQLGIVLPANKVVVEEICIKCCLDQTRNAGYPSAKMLLREITVNPVEDV